MGGPLLQIGDEPFLTFGFGAQFQHALLAQQVHGQLGGNFVRDFSVGGWVEIARVIVKNQSVASFIEFDELAGKLRIDWRNEIIEIIDLAVQQRIIGEKFDDAEWLAADSEDVAAAVVVTVGDFQDFGSATGAGHAVGKSQQHAERRFGVQAIANHLAVTRLKNVQ